MKSLVDSEKASPICCQIYHLNCLTLAKILFKATKQLSIHLQRHLQDLHGKAHSFILVRSLSNLFKHVLQSFQNVQGFDHSYFAIVYIHFAIS
jgi:hypothetical protein